MPRNTGPIVTAFPLGRPGLYGAAGQEPGDVSPQEAAVHLGKGLDSLHLHGLEQWGQVVQIVAHGIFGQVALSQKMVPVFLEMVPCFYPGYTQTAASTGSGSDSGSGISPRCPQAVQRAPFFPEATRSSPHSGHGSGRGRCLTEKSHVG